jgi:hypothetical protein
MLRRSRGHIVRAGANYLFNLGWIAGTHLNGPHGVLIALPLTAA